ncbi:hypothetical protein Nepgr_000686 [Nepenthes gracilis]|uniref:Uncharacterized protein n=1 Tax=Nepenthes gracilis TaxID=150966 RepID=A0AAD3RVL4_NEPGR|nr:hypothetical protein Nepgr_000686 [Nepenthes gracilis]
MFTEGLDESAINWIKKETDVCKEVRSPSKEKFAYDQIPKSPLLHGTGNFMSPHALPPLKKFHSGLLCPPRIATFDDECNYDNGYSYGDDESVASAPDDLDGKYSDNEEEVSKSNSNGALEKPIACGYDEDIVGLGASKIENSSMRSSMHHTSLINRGLSQISLKIEVPDSIRRFSYKDTWEDAHETRTPDSSNQCCSKGHPLSVHGTPIHHSSLYDTAGWGTPSAPPVNDSGKEESKPEVERKEEPASDGVIDERVGNRAHMARQAEYFEETTGQVPEVCAVKFGVTDELNDEQNHTRAVETEIRTPYWPANSVDSSPCYNPSGQNVWQTFVAYDACIRLCLHAWARGCPDAPEFLRDECLVLRSAFGLHKFLLQSQGVKPMNNGATNSIEQACSIKRKQVVGKIRVEVKKLRIIPRRKLRSIYSQRGAFYMQAGAEYVRHVSALMKNGLNSIMTTPLSAVTCEEKLLCCLS